MGYFVYISGKFDYDVVVIGGGSGGLACSKEGKLLSAYTGKAKSRLVSSGVELCKLQDIVTLFYLGVL